MSHPSTALCLSLRHAYVGLRRQLDEELGTFHGIDFDDFALLHCLANDSDGTTGLETLAADLGTSRADVLRRLRPLEKTGLVACHGDIKQRRVALRAPALSLMNNAHDTITRVCARPSLAGKLKKLDQLALNGQ